MSLYIYEIDNISEKVTVKNLDLIIWGVGEFLYTAAEGANSLLSVLRIQGRRRLAAPTAVPENQQTADNSDANEDRHFQMLDLSHYQFQIYLILNKIPHKTRQNDPGQQS